MGVAQATPLGTLADDDTCTILSRAHVSGGGDPPTSVGSTLGVTQVTPNGSLHSLSAGVAPGRRPSWRRSPAPGVTTTAEIASWWQTAEMAISTMFPIPAVIVTTLEVGDLTPYLDALVPRQRARTSSPDMRGPRGSQGGAGARERRRARRAAHRATRSDGSSGGSTYGEDARSPSPTPSTEDARSPPPHPVHGGRWW